MAFSFSYGFSPPEGSEVSTVKWASIDHREVFRNDDRNANYSMFENIDTGYSWLDRETHFKRVRIAKVGGNN
jgi:hypothetical protein